MDKTMNTMTSARALCMLLICVSVTSAQQEPSWRNFDKLRRGNCSDCQEILKMNLVEVLPRLEMIKQRIMNALGRDQAANNTSHDDVIRRMPNTHVVFSSDVARQMGLVPMMAPQTDTREILSYAHTKRELTFIRSDDFCKTVFTDTYIHVLHFLIFAILSK